MTQTYKEIYDFVNIHYVDNEDAEDELFEETKEKIRDEISLMALKKRMRLSLENENKF